MEGGVHEVIVTHVKPEHWFQFRDEIKKHPAFEAKHHIDVLGRYKPIAGGIGDLITFVHFGKLYNAMHSSDAKVIAYCKFRFFSDNMQQKVTETKALFEDPDFIAHHNKTAHFVDDVFVSTCVPVEGFPTHRPDPKSKKQLRRYSTRPVGFTIFQISGFVFVQKVHVKGFPRESVMAFKEFFTAANEKHMKPKGLNLIGVFRPVFGKNVQQCM